jgi:hypothetical protein
MGTSLKRIERKKLDVGLNRLSKFGVDVERWLAMVDADDATMQRLVAKWPFFSTPYAYDAVAILGFGNPGEEPLPDAKSGEVVIRYGGWSLRELYDSPVVRERKLMWEQDWYHKYPWSSEKLPGGIYRLRVPVPNSNWQTFAEQQGSLPSGEEPAPVGLVATALLAHRLQTGEDLLKTDYTRCKEQTADVSRVELDWYDGRLYVDRNWGGLRSDVLWLSSVRTS